MKRTVNVVLLAVACVLGSAHVQSRVERARAQADVVAGVVSWSAGSTDAHFFAGLEADYQRLDAEVAAVVTDARVRGRLIAHVGASLREIERARDQFLEEKRREHGLAPGTPLAMDGVSWVATR